ncbi:phosphodiester glycosidase family protein [Vitreoscilla massiliensis]|uniref:Phosphodiester glycosidase family protein n=1 Tax=Vitreoscilla massiliensis TaxID=1689272 RepID=A0ABY4E3Y4_9NEIS|nr:phosphodiester glycosidase family protein [Vitreoscilla massiliensis]UOO90466.1 phosphodiester glycosidase family protein [Vitreoscilla massiliensis]
MMKQRWQWLVLVLGLSTALSACHAAELATHTVLASNGVAIDVIKVDNLAELRLFLNNDGGHAYQSFAAVRGELPACERMQFGMNAGMFHANYQPVGLYVAQGKQFTPLNTDRGFGNFFMQPNGVLAWNQEQAWILSTADYARTHVPATYATQSGPMLVINQRINPQFLPHASSLKIRNGVGIKGKTLYFAISQKPVSFYQFAQVFQERLKTEQALYLDGSISSMYLPQTNREDMRHLLGPMLAVVSTERCAH